MSPTFERARNLRDRLSEHRVERRAIEPRRAEKEARADRLRGRLRPIGWTCRSSLLAALGVAALSAFTAGTCATSAAAAGGSGDFNGDGFTDLAIGAPRVDVDGIIDAGAVKELHGGPNGLTTSGRMWHQNKLRDAAETGDRFGSALAASDFNRDGFADLAIGVPYEDLPGFPPVGGKVTAGAVNVIYGSPTGLRAANNSFWHQDRPSVELAQAGDRFGSALAAGDFNNDGSGDLAIGVPYEDLIAKEDAGAVNLLYGYEDGLGAHGPFSRAFWNQDVPEVESIARTGDHFGFALAAANVGRSSHADLVIGVPGENVQGIRNAGALNVLYGSPSDLTVTGNQLLHRNVAGLEGNARVGDHFGSALAAAKLGRSMEADLAIGTPFADVDGKSNAGSVNVLYGTTSDGLTVTEDQIWHRQRGGVKGEPAPGDRFGSALAAADFDGRAAADLAIGAPFADVDGKTNAGAVNVLHSANGGLVSNAPPAEDDLWHRASTGVKRHPNTGDRFSSGLAASDFNGDGFADLAIGVPFAGIGDAGAVNVLYGSFATMTTDGGLVSNAPPKEDDAWDRRSPGIEGAPAAGDRFGGAL